MDLSEKQLKDMTANDWKTLAQFHRASAARYDKYRYLRGEKLRCEKLSRAFYALAEIYAEEEAE